MMIENLLRNASSWIQACLHFTAIRVNCSCFASVKIRKAQQGMLQGCIFRLGTADFRRPRLAVDLRLRSFSRRIL